MKKAVNDEDDAVTALKLIVRAVQPHALNFGKVGEDDRLTFKQVIDLVNEVNCGEFLDSLIDQVNAFTDDEIRAGILTIDEKDRAEYIDKYNDFFGTGDFSILPFEAL
jgi:hypothetical protein